MHKLADDWRALTPPLWDFSVEAGFPFPGEWQTAAFYPINILYVWLTGIPTPGKLDVLILFHFAAAMWGMSLFSGNGAWKGGRVYLAVLCFAGLGRLQPVLLHKPIFSWDLSICHGSFISLNVASLLKTRGAILGRVSPD